MVDKDKLSTTNKEFRYIRCTDVDVKAHFVVPINDKQYFEQRQIICGEPTSSYSCFSLFSYVC